MEEGEQLVEQKALRRKTGSHGKSGRTSRLKNKRWESKHTMLDFMISKVNKI